MGEVFVVEHVELGRLFVAKVLHAELTSDARIVDRMRVERQALGRLNHPHIVSVVDSAELADGRPFFVMERLRGGTLAEELQERGKLPVYEAVQLACQLLSALAAAHAIGIVHRDVKPANLFLCAGAEGRPRLLKVLDFGVARVLPGAPPAAPLPLSLPTDVGVLMGTPRYASPEAAGGSQVDTRADIYAAALMLYIMLAGRGPFDHHQLPASLLAAHAHDEPEPPSRLATEPVPFPLDQAVLRGLRKLPEERFQSADEFRTELEATLSLLRKPLGWVETTAFSKPDAELPPSETDSVSAPENDVESPQPPPAVEALAAPPSPHELETNTNPASALGAPDTERLDAAPDPTPSPTPPPHRGAAAFALPFALGVMVAGALGVLVSQLLQR
jgi:serine/threonine-protein kinase